MTWRTSTEPTELMGMWMLGSNAKYIDRSRIDETVLPRRAKMMVVIPAETAVSAATTPVAECAGID